MNEIADGLVSFDTLLGGREGITVAHLVRGPQPALIDTGAQTSVPAVRAALEEMGLGADDLAWIVLTHVHLDHAGGTGALAAAFPRARVVVHRRGARHLIDPTRLVAGSRAVYAEMAPLYGDLDPTPAERVDEAPDGHRVSVGPGRDLVMLETLGHARHHMSVLDEATGTVIAGDAVGVRMAGGGQYPSLPPPDVDFAAALASLDKIEAHGPTGLALSHFGAVPDAGEALATAREQYRALEQAVREAWRGDPSREAVARAVDAALPFEPTVGTPAAIGQWRFLGWADANIDGYADWAARDAELSARQ